MASSGNFVNDVVQKHFARSASHRSILRLSQLFTLLIGVGAVLVASRFERVLDVILHAYGFMVAGLFVPTVGALFWKRSSSGGALGAMLLGGALTVCLQLGLVELPGPVADIGLDPTLYGIACATIVFVALSLAFPPHSRSRGKT
jgi:SSS family solute:Na+ symporter